MCYIMRICPVCDIHVIIHGNWKYINELLLAVRNQFSMRISQPAHIEHFTR